ncbi:MAG TPA: M48 family metalloprotease [Candidatus Polarisedimenticolaceae bacterium]|nr:M48 family metalloprotease [Candidatus Polarisedimenticolaceae bacterium]
MRTAIVMWGFLAVLPAAAAAPPAADAPSARMDQVLDAAIAGEQALAVLLESHRPVVETYVQTVKPDAALGFVPVRDNYFFGRLELASTGEPAKQKKSDKKNKQTLSLLQDFHSAVFKPEDFSRMLLLDRGSFDRNTYEFHFLRSEFLGDVRTLVFDVTPKEGKPLDRYRPGRFTGRIWVEDQAYRIVRYNGIYASSLAANFHFDSWRTNVGQGQWLPSYVYTEEADKTSRQLNLSYRGQIRVWGYQLEKPDADDEFTKVMLETPVAHDASDGSGQTSPVEAARQWQLEAEENVVRRLTDAGLLAPKGKLDAILETVVNNLEVTNNLEMDPPVHCRVLLTTPLESFTIGRTIVLSRGLIDVLPDEASLAAIVAHELGHVMAGHELDTRYAFTDRVLVGDREAVARFQFERTPQEEMEADAKAVALLKNSPYKDKLAAAGLFFKALQAQASALPYLIQPHFGNGQVYRMAPIVDAAPALDPGSITQIAALPLGGRVRVDPWTAAASLMPGAKIALVSAREKMPFQVTPLMPYLSRIDGKSEPEKTTATLAEKAASAPR